ncbi:MAG: hypothetical protein N2450_04725 [bacterium]|nr:hypothetical protein [bacterium]
MIDLHSHIFPYIDDGSESWEMTERMLRNAVQEGTSEIVWTPHVMDGYNSEYREKILQRYEEGIKFIEKNKIPIKVHLGSEIYITRELSKFKNEIFGTYRGVKKVFLIEFPMYDYHPNFRIFLSKYMDEGYRITLAHPERYVKLHTQKSEYEKLKKDKIYMQINAGSIRGDFGDKTKSIAKWLIQEGLADLVASDGHNDTSRPLGMSSVYHQVVLWTNNQQAKSLFETTPRLLLYNEV